MPLNWILRVLGSSPISEKPLPSTIECDLTKVTSIVEPLVRSQEQKEKREQWLQTRAYTKWLDFFQKQYNNYNCGCKLAPCDSRLSFNVAKCTRGFVLKFDEKGHNIQDFQYLLDHFAQALARTGYTLQAADIRTYICPSERKETIERYYLKPPTTCKKGDKIEQCFGNITLTLHARGGVPMYLQCRAAHYRDMTIFQPSHSLGKLVECLVKDKDKGVSKII
ncbi:MAG: hypothetical protein RI894_1702 [Bacteroidota bacterium]|jgi:hypothetical protein